MTTADLGLQGLEFDFEGCSGLFSGEAYVRVLDLREVPANKASGLKQCRQCCCDAAEDLHPRRAGPQKSSTRVALGLESLGLLALSISKTRIRGFLETVDGTASGKS